MPSIKEKKQQQPLIDTEVTNKDPEIKLEEKVIEVQNIQENVKKGKEKDKIEQSKTTSDDSKQYIIVTKWQLYSFFRKWFINSIPTSDDTIDEKYIKNNILYIFNKDNLPKVTAKNEENNKFDVIIEVEIPEELEYIIKNEWKIIWLKGFVPITVIKKIFLIREKELEIFNNPVPNYNNNFVIPQNLSIVNSELYELCKNEFKPYEWNNEDNSGIVELIEKYGRILWSYFFTNFGIYANDINENSSSTFLSLLNETYNDLAVADLQQLNETNWEPIKLMKNLAYNWEFAKVQSTDELIELLMTKNIINLSDRNYIKENFDSLSWRKNLDEFFNYKENTPDNAIWQIITYLLKFCNNKSLDQRSRELSQFVMQKYWDLKPNKDTLFTLWLCCWFNYIVCENNNPWRIALKDTTSPIRTKLLKDLYNFIITWNINKDSNFIKKSEEKPTREPNDNFVIKKEKYIINWEERLFVADKLPYSTYYPNIMKARYWKDYERIEEGVYMLTLLQKRVPERRKYNNITKIVDEMIKKVSRRDEELEWVMKLDREYSLKK